MDEDKHIGSVPVAEHIQNTLTPNKTERIRYEQERTRATGWLRYFAWMGDLPEWKVNGQHLSGRTLNLNIGFIASCGFLMFGYDQGVLSALLTLDSFQDVLALMTPREKSNNLCWLDPPDNTIPDPDECIGDANTQAAAVAIYQIGCWLGSLVILVYGEKWGRKSSTFWGSLIMIVGTILQAGTFEYGCFVVGRVVGGIGNGMVTASMHTVTQLMAIGTDIHSNSDVAKRMRSPASAWGLDYALWRPYFSGHYDCLLD